MILFGGSALKLINNQLFIIYEMIHLYAGSLSAVHFGKVLFTTFGFGPNGAYKPRTQLLQ
jgi:hypothetical protein